MGDETYEETCVETCEETGTERGASRNVTGVRAIGVGRGLGVIVLRGLSATLLTLGKGLGTGVLLQWHCAVIPLSHSEAVVKLSECIGHSEMDLYVVLGVRTSSAVMKLAESDAVRYSPSDETEAPEDMDRPCDAVVY